MKEAHSISQLLFATLLICAVPGALLTSCATTSQSSPRPSYGYGLSDCPTPAFGSYEFGFTLVKDSLIPFEPAWIRVSIRNTTATPQPRPSAVLAVGGDIVEMNITPPPSECGFFIGNSPCDFSADSLQPEEEWIDFQAVCAGQGSRFQPGDYTVSISVPGYAFLERPPRPSSPCREIPLTVVECPAHETLACSLAYLGWTALWQGSMDSARTAWDALITNCPNSRLAPMAAWTKWNSEKWSASRDSVSLNQWYKEGLDILRFYPLSPECTSYARSLINSKGLAFVEGTLQEIERKHPNAPVIQERLARVKEDPVSPPTSTDR